MYLIVLSEAWDFAIDNTLYLCIVALVSFFVGLELSGKGIITQTLARQRIQKLNSDLERVRELQQQLDVLRAVQKNKLCATPGLTEEEPQKKRESIARKLDFSNAVPNQSSMTPTDDDTNITSSSCDSSHKECTEMGAICHAYEGMKDAWTWGRHETPLAPILGLAEGITSATVGLFGTDLKGIDDGLKPHVEELDEHVMKPAIKNVMTILSDLKRDGAASEIS